MRNPHTVDIPLINSFSHRDTCTGFLNNMCTYLGRSEKRVFKKNISDQTSSKDILCLNHWYI